LVLLRLQEVQELTDLVAVLGRVPHCDVRVDAVTVATADPLALDVPGVDQVGDDALSGSLGDTHMLSDVTQPGVRITVEAEQNLGVVREEPPRFLMVVIS
jgi:hypothetical protein